MTVLLNSNILIEVSRGRNAGIISEWTELSNSDVAVLYLPVCVAELWVGARPAEYNALNNLFRALTHIPIDAATGRQAGAYLREYRKSPGVEMADALVAADAQATHALLCTQKRSH